MASKELYITETDLQRIKALLDTVAIDERRERNHLTALERELQRATVVLSEDVPADAVTMNSTVRLLDLDSGRTVEYTIVYPSDADASEGRISVLAPIGTALLGYRTGSEIAWKVPSGVRRFRIEEILFQPEAAGLYNL